MTLRLANPKTCRGFTLVEIMITIAIMAVMLGVGVPSMWRAMQRDDLARAIKDTIEGCKTARDRAILQGIVYEFVVTSEGELNVVPRPDMTREGGDGSPSGAALPSSPYSDFPRKLGEDVMIQLIGVNFVELMQAPEARVRFYPNGTSDEFTVVYAWKGNQRTVKLDVVTGLAFEYFRE